MSKGIWIPAFTIPTLTSVSQLRKVEKTPNKPSNFIFSKTERDPSSFTYPKIFAKTIFILSKPLRYLKRHNKNNSQLLWLIHGLSTSYDPPPTQTIKNWMKGTCTLLENNQYSSLWNATLEISIKIPFSTPYRAWFWCIQSPENPIV